VAYGLWILAGENVDTCCFATATPAGCSRPSLGSESAGMMRHSSSSVVDLSVRPQSRVLGACLVVSARCCCRVPRLKRPPLSCCGRHLTFAPRTPAPSRKQLSRTSALALLGYGGVYPGRGQMSSTSADAGGAYSHAPLNM